MKATYLSVVTLALLGACATQEDAPSGPCNPRSVDCHAAGAPGAGAGSAGGGAVAGTNAGGASGTAGASGSAQAGTTPQGGSAQGGGGAAQGGAAQAGAGQGGAPQGGAAQGGGGAAQAGAAQAGAPQAGAAQGGSGGAPPQGGCTVAIPARTAWVGTANPVSDTDTPAKAFDGDLGTRFATGTKMVGTELFQIDLGAGKGSVNKVTVLTSNADYGRHIKVRMSDTSNDVAAAVLTEADGITGTQTFSFATTTKRYITLQQTGMLETGVTWWSMYEINAFCN